MSFFYYTLGENNALASCHVMLVAQINEAPGREVTMNDVVIVEAMLGGLGHDLGTSNRVVAVRTLLDIHEDNRRWVLGRLIRSGG